MGALMRSVPFASVPKRVMITAQTNHDKKKSLNINSFQNDQFNWLVKNRKR